MLMFCYSMCIADLGVVILDHQLDHALLIMAEARVEVSAVGGATGLVNFEPSVLMVGSKLESVVSISVKKVLTLLMHKACTCFF